MSRTHTTQPPANTASFAIPQLREDATEVVRLLSSRLSRVNALFSRTIEYLQGDINNRLNRVAG